MATKSTRSSQTAKKKPASGTKGKTGSLAAKKKTAAGNKSTKAAGSRNRTSAGSKKNTGSAKRSTAKKAASSAKTNRQPVNDEVLLIVVLAISAIMLLGIFGLGGKMGDRIARGLFGLFGQMTYLIPFVLFIGVAFHISNRRNPLAHLKMTAFAILLFAIATIITVVSQQKLGISSLRDAYAVASATHKGGGILGCILGLPLYTYFGKIASILILVCIILVTGVLVTGKRFFMNLGAWLAQFVDWAKDRMQDISDRRAQIRMEREEERRQEEETERLLLEQEEQRAEEEEPFVVFAEAEEREPEEIPPLPDRKKNKKESASAKAAAASAEEQPARARKPSFLQNLEEEPEEREEPGGKKGSESFTGSHFEVPEFLKGGKFTHNPHEFAKESGKTEEETESIEAALEKQFSEVLAEQSKQEEAEVSAPFEELEAVERPSEETEIPAEIPDEADEADASDETASHPRGEGGSRRRNTGKITMTEEEAAAAEKEISDEIAAQPVVKYVIPPLELLDAGSKTAQNDIQALKQTALKLQNTFDSFGVGVTVTDATRGPTVTRYEVTPDTGVKVKGIVNLENDLKLNLAVTEIRIEAPIPGKAAVGIEVPNTEKEMVCLRDLLSSDKAKTLKSKISFAVGKDIAGQCIFGDIEKMPHLLIAGATGSGKSVCINTIVMSILYRADPSEVKMIMIDPKVVELSIYNGIPHLLVPVVTDPRKAAAALNWAVANMMERYKEFSKYRVRNIKEYNKKLDTINTALPDEEKLERMPQIVIIIDELADLMMVAQAEVENSIQRLSQLARAAGIHLVIATQRPSVNVITGTIKANIPSRIAFSVSSGVDSRTILDMIGAEKLLGNGDMLFMPQGISKPVRIQGAFVSDEEIARVTDFIKAQYEEPVAYDEQITSDIEESVKNIGSKSGPGSAAGQDAEEDKDVYFEEAGRLFIEKDKATIGMLQRALRIGFNRASRLMDQLCDYGVVGPETGTKPRKILMKMEEFEELLKNM